MKKNTKKVAFISSFLPRKCGIATFTSDLISELTQTAPNSFEPLVVAMRSASDGDCQYSEPVKFEIRNNVKNDYICAADYLNFSHVDLVSVQHEFGLFGGSAGSYLNLLLQRVNAPIITTLHTVLEEPDPAYHQSLIDVCELSHKIIVMNERGVDMLQKIYGVDTKKIHLVPHGIPDLPFVDSNYYKHKFAVEGRRTILTFGLLGKSKGIEMMLYALPEIVKADPSVLYIILGATHPNVLRHEGEEYRFSLKKIVNQLNLQENVIFHNRFVVKEELHNFLCAADIYVTPYLNREQLTSGTLAYAVGTGKAVVSTPYWAAEELLADGRGKLVPFGNSNRLADAIIELIKDEKQFYSLRRKAYDYGRNITWPMVAKTYWKMFSDKKIPITIKTKARPSVEQAVSILEVPEPPLIHLKRLSDDTGLIQHAKFTVPNREHGYCTDDNARAVVAMTKYYNQYAEPEALRLLDTYLSFVFHAVKRDDNVKNFMAFDRNWVKNEPAHDAHGRTLWALGTVMSTPPLPKYLPVVKDYFDRLVKHAPHLPPRGKAYAIFGMAEYLKQFPGASDIKRILTICADHLAGLYELYSKPDWQWFENIMTYDNAVLPHALFLAANNIGEEKYLQIAQNSCMFLLSETFNGENFSFIGCNGWYPYGGKKAKFDQQPIEVAATTMLLRTAYDTTKILTYLELQRKAFDWFLGANDLNMPVYDFRTKGCYDGLGRSGVNINQGAESMVSFLLSLLCIVESYSTTRKMEEEQNLFTQGLRRRNKNTQPAINIIEDEFNTKKEKQTLDPA